LQEGKSSAASKWVGWVDEDERQPTGRLATGQERRPASRWMGMSDQQAGEWMGKSGSR